MERKDVVEEFESFNILILLPKRMRRTNLLEEGLVLRDREIVILVHFEIVTIRFVSKKYKDFSVLKMIFIYTHTYKNEAFSKMGWR